MHTIEPAISEAGLLAPWIFTGRDLVVSQLRQQLGRNLMAISGGRIVHAGESAVLLPVASGYYVAVIIEANDTYTVARVLKRGVHYRVKGVMRDIYADEVGEIAYQASCFRDGEWSQS